LVTSAAQRLHVQNKFNHLVAGPIISGRHFLNVAPLREKIKI
jgi:hypothetical protein